MERKLFKQDIEILTNLKPSTMRAYLLEKGWKAAERRQDTEWWEFCLPGGGKAGINVIETDYVDYVDYVARAVSVLHLVEERPICEIIKELGEFNKK